MELGSLFVKLDMAIGNNTWIGLLALIPYVGFVMAIILGIKGKQWAWKDKKWESVEHFQRVQKKWAYWGAAVFLLLFFVTFLAAIIIPILVRMSQ